MQKEPMRREVFVRLRLLVFLTTVFAMSFLIMLAVQSAHFRRALELVDDAQAQVHEMNAKKDELERHYAFTETDAYVAQEARRRFGYLAEGERRYMIEGTKIP